MTAAGDPAGATSVRRHNLSLVLRTLVDEGPRSRAGLATRTGLTKATVSKLVNELRDRRLVRESDAVRGGAGRPAVLVSASDAVVGLGLVIDVDHVSAGLVDLSGTLVSRATTPCDNDNRPVSDVLADVGRVATRVLRSGRADGRLAFGTSVACPGLVHEGTIVVAPNLGWHDVDASALITRRLRGRAGAVSVGNEANLAALAELTGAGGYRQRQRERRNGSDQPPTFVAVSAGVGIGAGVVIRGVVERGAHGFGGELGHFVVEPSGRRCACGNRGCLETVVGARDLRRAARIRPNMRSATPSAWTDTMTARATAGDADVLAALSRAADALATALAATVSLLDPDAVVLGGFLGPLAPWLASPIEKALDTRVLGSRYRRYDVVASHLGPDGPLIGAGLAGVLPVIDDPLAVRSGTGREGPGTPC